MEMLVWAAQFVGSAQQRKWEWDWPHINDWLFHHKGMIAIVLLLVAFFLAFGGKRR